MKKYNIGITANTCWYIYNFRLNTIRQLISKGYFVYVIAPVDEYTKRLTELGVTHIDIYIDQGGTNPLNDFRTLISFYKIYSSRIKLHVVLNFTPKNNIYSTVAAYFNGIKVINNIAGLGLIFINQGLMARVVLSLYRISQRFADKVFFQNDDDKTAFLENRIISESIADRLPGSGVDLDRFKFSPADNQNKTVFILVARMLYDKGVGHYVEAARYLKGKYGDRVEFKLLGFLDSKNPSAITSEQMDSWVKEGVVNYLGTSDCVESIVSEVDCVVLPSYYREGVPRSLLEAASMGKPIITTDSVGCRETVQHGINGYLCAPQSTESLIEMLDRFIKLQPEDRVSMGLASREKAEKEFDENIILEKYNAAIEACLN